MSNRGAPDIVALGLAAAWAGGLAYALTLDDPRLRFPGFLAGVGVATLAWLGLVDRARRGALSPRACGLAVVLALAARALALTLPPAFSEDVFRYVYEGRVVWVMGPAFPFIHPPAAAPALGVPPELLDAAWLRVNHPEVPTIYPPLAQLVFVAAAGLGTWLGGAWLPVLKVAFVAAELGAAALLARAIAARGGRREEALLILLSPLAVLEVGREGHVDALSMFGLSLGIWGFVRLRPRSGYAGFALAALAKLNGLVALVAAARATHRGLGVGLSLAALCLLPFVLAGPAAAQGLGAYASAWRAGDGAFTLALTLAEGLLGGDFARVSLGSLGSATLTAHQLARGLTLCAFAGWAGVVLGRRPAPGEVPARAGLLLLGLLLLSPTLHPWYALWLLPFPAVLGSGRTAALALLSLAPILHHPGWLELSTGAWTDVAGLRALVHVPVWGLLARDLFRARALG